MWYALNEPGASGTVITEGLDLVDVRGERIIRNEVYLDRSALLES
jgi:hypothetical protein